MTEYSGNKFRCGICLSNFRNPKILTCFHTFCLHCLEENYRLNAFNGTFTCPVCRTVITVPKGGLAEFQTNFYLDTYMDAALKGFCEACCKEAFISSKCLECNQCFCQGCCEVHLRMAASKDHKLIELSKEDKTRIFKLHFCEQHKLAFSAYCSDCNSILCDICRNSSHIDHTCADIPIVAEHKRMFLNNLIESSEENINDLVKDADIVRKQAESKFIYFSQQIEYLKNEENAVIAAINENFKSFEERISTMNQEQLIKALELTDERRRLISVFKETVTETKEAMSRDDDSDMIKNFEERARKLKEIEVTLTPAVSGEGLMKAVESCTTWLLKIQELNRTKAN